LKKVFYTRETKQETHKDYQICTQPISGGGGNKTHQHKPPTQWNNTYNIHKYMGSNAMESSYPKNNSKKKRKKKKNIVLTATRAPKK
jgi:hypothetical protein